MNKLARQLIDLGNAKPELRKHLKPILDKVANTTVDLDLRASVVTDNKMGMAATLRFSVEKEMGIPPNTYDVDEYISIPLQKRIDLFQRNYRGKSRFAIESLKCISDNKVVYYEDDCILTDIKLDWNIIGRHISKVDSDYHREVSSVEVILTQLNDLRGVKVNDLLKGKVQLTGTADINMYIGADIVIGVEQCNFTGRLTPGEKLVRTLNSHKVASNSAWEREFDKYLEWLDNDRQRWRVDLSLGDFVPGSSQRRYERILDLLDKGWTVGTEDGGLVLKSRGEEPNVPLNLVETDFVKYLLY